MLSKLGKRGARHHRERQRHHRSGVRPAECAPRITSPQTTPVAVTARPEGSGALSDKVEHLGRDTIIKALEQTRYNKTAVAKLLDLSTALRYKIQKLEIE